MTKNYVIGVDEVGRGALAGPVVVCAALLKIGQKVSSKKLGLLRDSKKLSAKQREAWVKVFKDIGINCMQAKVSPLVIDRINISRAANLAAWRAVSRLVKENCLRPKDYSIYLDGGLYLKNKTFSAGLAQTVVRGDEKIKAVAIASIFAKVNRDKQMVKLGKELPEYGLEAHKGYGTAKHLTAIKKHGISPHHRVTFVS